MKSRSFLSAIAMVALLSACGGDADDVLMQAEDQVPASALMSAQAFSAYAASVAPADRAEPLSLDGVEPPTSETAEPIDVN